MRFLGIDQSLTSTGICVLNKEGEVQHTKLIPTSTKDGNLSERLTIIHNTITELIAEYPPTISCIEGPAFLSHHRSFDIFAVAGAILCALPQPVLIVAPATLKKFATGHGCATKDDMIASAYSECTNDNLADAYWLAKVAYLYYYTEKANRYQLLTLTKLRRT